jgi:hypothetical protein
VWAINKSADSADASLRNSGKVAQQLYSASLVILM